MVVKWKKRKGDLAIMFGCQENEGKENEILSFLKFITLFSL